MDANTRSIIFKIVLDLTCLFLVGFPILLFYVAGSPFERGFYCDDESLRHPYKENTVRSWCLYVFGLGIPITSIVLSEFLLYNWSNDKSDRKIHTFTIQGWMIEVYRHVGVFGFGAAVSQFTTDIAKYTIGRLRPHFFDVCRPNVQCDDPSKKNIYITWFECTGQDKNLIKDMRLSFPSGHASFSWYCAIFVAMYLHAKITWKGSKLLKHLLQFIVLALAFYTALSRISDYKHHWSDVLCGSIFGIITAVMTVVFVSDIFSTPKLAAVITAETDGSCADKLTPPAQRHDSAI